MHCKGGMNEAGINDKNHEGSTAQTCIWMRKRSALASRKRACADESSSSGWRGTGQCLCTSFSERILLPDERYKSRGTQPMYATSPKPSWRVGR